MKFHGCLPVTIFDACPRACDVIVGLTRLSDSQIGVASEAGGIGKPMVLSCTDVLKKLFYKGAVFVDSSNPESIAKDCLVALDKLKVLAAESSALCEERRQMCKKNRRIQYVKYYLEDVVLRIGLPAARMTLPPR